MRRRLIWILLALLLALSGCAQGEKPYVPTGNALAGTGPLLPTVADPEQGEQELTMVYYPDRSMNPLLSSDYTNRTLMSLIYQGLFAVDREYQVHPILCDHYTVSEDLKTYTFYLANATFSDGSRVQMEDVLASLEAAKESSFYQGRFLHVNSMGISEDGGLTISLGTPYEDLTILLDIPILKATQLEEDRPLGTGPYQLDSGARGLRLRRRQNWWCQSPDLAVTASSIELVQAESEAQIRDEFEFYDVGLVCADPGVDSYADYRCDYELWDSENGMFLYLGCLPTSSVFSVPEVRAALTYAIDRDRIVEEYYRGFARSTVLPASPLSPYYNSGLASHYGYEPERFAQAVQEAQLTGQNVTLLVNGDDSLRLRTARAICEMLEAAGLVPQLTVCTSANLKAYLNAQNYDLYLAQTKLSPNMDLSNFFYVRGSLNYGGMGDVELYELCKNALENRGNYYDLYRRILEDGRMCPILFRSYAVYATRGLLTGLTPSRDNVFFYTVLSTEPAPAPTESTEETTESTTAPEETTLPDPSSPSEPAQNGN